MGFLDSLIAGNVSNLPSGFSASSVPDAPTFAKACADTIRADGAAWTWEGALVRAFAARGVKADKRAPLVSACAAALRAGFPNRRDRVTGRAAWQDATPEALAECVAFACRVMLDTASVDATPDSEPTGKPAKPAK